MSTVRGGVIGGLVVAVLCGYGALRSHAAAREPSAALEDIDTAFAASVAALERRAAALGDDRLVALLRDWNVTTPADRQIAYAIPPRLERPDWIAGDAVTAIWDDFVAARNRRAAATFEHALDAAHAHRDVPTRAERAAPPADRPSGSRRSSEAMRLVYRTLRDDPTHTRARAAIGSVRRGDEWVWPPAARRLDRGEEYDAAFGWLPKGRLARYRAGERHERGRWISAEEDDRRVPGVDRGRRFDSDHWEILSAAPLAAAAGLAARLEETFVVWQQVFGTIGATADTVERRLTQTSPPRTTEPFAAVLCADRRQFVTEVARSVAVPDHVDGLYWTPTRTAWFFHAEPAGGDGAPRPDTVHHEATHQLCVEAGDPSRTSKLAGERTGFWAIEALACHMESIRPAPAGWTVGGRDAGRVPRAREILIDEEFQVPLARLTSLSREDFQSHERLEDLYAQTAGLADFLMNGSSGRYREAFLEYCGRVYAGTADADTLARLCRTSYAELDAAYRAHLAGE
jgi:hypothetical protein